MKSKLSIVLLLVSLATLFSACTKIEAESAKADEVFIDDKNKASDDEVFIDDSAFKDKSAQISTVTESREELKRTLADASVVQTLIDGFGNKTEVRFFKDNSRLRFVVLQTSVDGKKQVTVYGFDKDTKTLPGNFGDRALTASGDEIADTAGLYATRSFQKSKNFMKGKGNLMPTLQPLPSSSFPIQARRVEEIKTEKVDESTTANPQELTKSETTQSNESKKVTTSSSQPESEK